MSPGADTPTGKIGTVRFAEGDFVMQLDTDDLAGVLKRLKRAQGQIGGIIRMIEDGRDCKEIVTQLAAVSKALDRAGFAVIAAGLKQCISDDPSGSSVDTSSLEKLFLSLA